MLDLEASRRGNWGYDSFARSWGFALGAGGISRPYIRIRVGKMYPAISKYVKCVNAYK